MVSRAPFAGPKPALARVVTLVASSRPSEGLRTVKAATAARPYLATDKGKHQKPPAGRPGRPKRKPGTPTHRKARAALTRAEVDELFTALNFARRVPAGRVGTFAEPNRSITTVWGMTSRARLPAPDNIRHVLTRAAQFMRRTGEPTVWAYVQEWGPVKGVHWHLLIYVPADQWRTFRKRFRSWAGGKGAAIDFTDIRTMHGQKLYLAKESADDVRADRGVPDDERHARRGGEVMGKRMAVSTTINRAARKRAGFGVAVVEFSDFRRAA